MKYYRAEQIAKYLIRSMHRGGRKFKRFKLDRQKFKKWLREEYNETDM